MAETNGAPCGHTGTHRCNGLTKCRMAIRNLPGQRLSDFLTGEEMRRLATIPFPRAGEIGACGGCGEEIANELDFARHFIIPDMRYPGLGNCPNEKRI